MIHLKLIFVYIMRFRSELIFLDIGDHLLKRLSFLDWIVFMPCQKLVLCVCESVSGVFILFYWYLCLSTNTTSLLLLSTCAVLAYLSHVQLFVTPWTVACQAPLSMGILQAKILKWMPCSPPGDLSTQEFNQGLPLYRQIHYRLWASWVAQTVKNLPALQETQISSLSWKDPLEKGMATHSCILAWKVPWTEGPGGFNPWGCKESDMLSD